MKVVPYAERYKQDFIDLNQGWIETLFEMEPEDYRYFLQSTRKIQYWLAAWWRQKEMTSGKLKNLLPEIWEREPVREPLA